MEGVALHIFFELQTGFYAVPTAHKSVILVILSIYDVLILCKMLLFSNTRCKTKAYCYERTSSTEVTDVY